MFKLAVAEPMPDHVRVPWLANGQRRHAPDIPAVIVTQVDDLRWGVADRVIRPGRQLILLCVERPGAANSIRGGHESETRIGNHVAPRCRCPLFLVQNDHVLARRVGKAAHTVEEFERRRRACRFGPCPTLFAARGRPGERCRLAHFGDLFAQRAASRHEHGARSDLQQNQHRLRQRLLAQRKHAASASLAVGGRARCANGGIDRLLQQRSVRGRHVVQDHEIHRELFQAPVFMGTQQFLDDLQVVFVVDSDEHDRHIARYAERP